MKKQKRLPFLFFIIISLDVTSQQYLITPVNRESFMKSFMGSVAQSGVFTESQLNNMTDISDTITSSMEKMARSGKSSKSMLQALNMAFASSIAEIAVSEQGGAPLDVKSNVIVDALSNAILQTTGTVNNGFINEITQL